MKPNKKSKPKSNSSSHQAKWECICAGIYSRWLTGDQLSVVAARDPSDANTKQVKSLVDKFYSQVGFANGKAAISENTYLNLVASGYNYSPAKFLKKGGIGSVSEGLYRFDAYEELGMLFFYLTQAGIQSRLREVAPEAIGQLFVSKDGTYSVNNISG